MIRALELPAATARSTRVPGSLFHSAATCRTHRSPVLSTRPSNFEEAWQATTDVEGWMTRDQARRLWDRASELGSDARIVEIGSFRGRSMIILASAAPEGTEIIAIDPHLGTDRGPQEIVTTEALGQSDNDVFNRNLSEAQVAERVTHVRKLSSEALNDVDGRIEPIT